jgi:branched-chain amino acid transport system substrate-binding protein
MAWIAVLAGAVLSLPACGADRPAAALPITIGVSASLTGEFSDDGKALKQGYDLWAQDINAKGGLLKHRVTMKYIDDASSPQLVATNYETLMTVDKVALVFGPVTSLLNIPASAVAERYGYAFPEPAGGAPAVFSRGLKNIFFVQPAAVEDNLVSYTQWLLALPAGQRPTSVAYATQDDPFTLPQVDKARRLLEAGGVKTAYYKVYSAATTDFGPVAMQVAASKAEAVVVGTQTSDAIAFARTFIQQHYNPKAFIATSGPDQGSAYSAALGANTEGIMVPAGWSASATAYDNTTFVNHFIAKFGGAAADISSTAAEAYSVGQVVDQAATRANSLDNARLIATLHSGTYQTIQGPIGFDATGKPQGGAGVYISQWQNGNAVFVYPSSVAAAAPAYPKRIWK